MPTLIHYDWTTRASPRYRFPSLNGASNRLLSWSGGGSWSYANLVPDGSGEFGVWTKPFKTTEKAREAFHLILGANRHVGGSYLAALQTFGPNVRLGVLWTPELDLFASQGIGTTAPPWWRGIDTLAPTKTAWAHILEDE